MNNKNQPQAPLACKLTEAEMATRGEDVIRELFAAVTDTVALDDGYEFHFPGDDSWLISLTELIQFERACCPFFRFELVMLPNCEAIWLRMRGGEAVKRFVEEVLLAEIEAPS